MAVRIRKDGSIWCAALNDSQEGDLYIDDALHYHLSVVEKVLVTTDNNYHMSNKGQWWWRGNNIPANIKIDDFYLN